MYSNIKTQDFLVLLTCCFILSIIVFNKQFNANMSTFLFFSFYPSRESFESLMQQHTYARSPLRSYTEAEIEESFKQHKEMLARGECIFKPFFVMNISKVVLLLWIFYVFLSCVCYAFVSVCLYMPCGHLLGKG